MLNVAVRELPEYIARELPPSPWPTVEREPIRAFANATLDRRFIHGDENKAARGSSTCPSDSTTG